MFLSALFSSKTSQSRTVQAPVQTFDNEATEVIAVESVSPASNAENEKDLEHVEGLPDESNEEVEILHKEPWEEDLRIWIHDRIPSSPIWYLFYRIFMC